MGVMEAAAMAVGSTVVDRWVAVVLEVVVRAWDVRVRVVVAKDSVALMVSRTVVVDTAAAAQEAAGWVAVVQAVVALEVEAPEVVARVAAAWVAVAKGGAAAAREGEVWVAA